MNFRIAGLLLLCCSVLVGCATVVDGTNSPQISQLQLRALQSRSYEGSDEATVIKTLLNVLQDEGFLVHYGDMALGLLNANKTLDSASVNQYPVSLGSGQYHPGGLGIKPDYSYYSNTQPEKFTLGEVNPPSGPFATSSDNNLIRSIDATVNVSKFGDKVKVRVSFQRKLLNMGGLVLDLSPLVSPKLYQEFFAKVDKGLFIQKQGL